MITSTKLELAINLAKHMHTDQKYGRYSYMVHLHDVADLLETDTTCDETTLIVAYLHDILEDTNLSVTVIEHLFGGVISSAVVAISKSYVARDGFRIRSAKSNKDYIARVKRNTLSLRVKIADTRCNLAQSQLDGDTKRVEKYSRQLALLQE